MAIVLAACPGGLLTDGARAPAKSFGEGATTLAGMFPTPIRHVIVVFFENTEVNTTLAGAPFERSIAAHYAFASQFYAVAHYSLPDYLAATSGAVKSPATPFSARNIGDLAKARNLSWDGIMEGMPTACDRQDDWSVGYDVAHDPFVWYSDVIHNPGRCDQRVVNMTAWNASLAVGTLPNYVFLSPDTFDDAHNGTLLQADAWLANLTRSLLGHPRLFASTALFVTYDEGTSNLGFNGTSGGHVYLALVSPFARFGYNSTHPYNTISLLTTAEWLLGLGRTGHNDNWSVNPPMRDLFNFAKSYAVGGSVTDLSGTPIVNATISDGLGVSTTTNASGGFVLYLSSGSYNLTASAAGLVPVTRSIVVHHAAITGIRFRL
ncbi:MAG TPA: alkaline phosphatase family protein [Thermoplasmata archaeon]|nr:alkaline phosphatase family protein [Thermoplasmata archaeon]